MVFISGMLMFLFFRLGLLLTNLNQTHGTPANIIVYAIFNRGSLFDAAVNSYVLVIPFLLLTIGYFFNIRRKLYSVISVVLVNIFYVVSISFLSSDIAYYSYFNSRLTNSLLNWSDEFWLSVYTRFSVPTYYPYVFIFLIISVFFCLWINFLAKRTIYQPYEKSDNVLKKIVVFSVFSVLVVLGMRGDYHTDKMPLSVSNSFFADYSFPNQLGLNPVYSFLSSFKHEKPSFMIKTNFVQNTQNYLGIKHKYDSPIARDVTFNTASTKPNVVILIVESLSAYKFKRYGYPDNIMPFLDSIMNVSATFDNIYTSGIHTYDGIYSSLFSMPSGLNHKAMTFPLTAGQKHSGVSNVLKQHGYKTAFFCTGDKRFDNMNGFLINNDFDFMFSQDDYPKEFNFTEWGVPDNVMFDYSLDKLNDFSKSGNPFLAAYMTVSTHESIALPDWVPFKPDAKDSYDCRYQYFDWSLSEFIKKAQTTDWFKNTIFVIIADHGQNFDPVYDLSLSYNHSPMIFFAPYLIKPSRSEKPGLQIDLFPTLMGFVKLPYVNNTLGVDLLNEGREFAYFCSDDKIGCIDEDFFLVIRKDGPSSLYNYKQKDLTNYINEYQSYAQDMRKYAETMIETAYWMGEHKFLSLPGQEKNK
jgi:phosphoglycerol transferase MdoB-like AlkP superfamily enzyme